MSLERERDRDRDRESFTVTQAISNDFFKECRFNTFE